MHASQVIGRVVYLGCGGKVEYYFTQSVNLEFPYKIDVRGVNERITTRYTSVHM